MIVTYKKKDESIDFERHTIFHNKILNIVITFRRLKVINNRDCKTKWQIFEIIIENQSKQLHQISPKVILSDSYYDHVANDV